MYKMLIADDEPLVQVGIKSILNYEELAISIVGVADNGNTALQMIRSLSPDIVIIDIKMPIFDGLEVMEIIRNELESPPIFIILTSYDDFEYARCAMRNGAENYLLKIELNTELLTKTLNNAIKQLKQREMPRKDEGFLDYIHSKRLVLVDNFFMKLLNNWFSSDEEISEMISDLQIDFNGNWYLVIYFDAMTKDAKETKLTVPNSAVYMHNIIQEICDKYFKCYVVPWNFFGFAAILSINSIPNWRDDDTPVLKCINHIQNMVFKYQNISLFSAVGSIVSSMIQIPNSFSESMAACTNCSENNKIVIFDQIINQKSYSKIFNISIIRDELTTALNSYDAKKIEKIFNELIDVITSYITHHEQSIAICSSILHFIMISYNNSEQMITEIFSKNYQSYYDLYKLKTTSQVTAWLNTFKVGLCSRIVSDFGESKNWLVPNIKKYIEEHYNEPLSLSDVAQAFDISGGYVSSIFKKYNHIGFSECVTQAKIKHASQLLLEPNAKIYEVSNMLGYSDPYYFSKVFKRITGLSPKEYIIRSNVR